MSSTTLPTPSGTPRPGEHLHTLLRNVFGGRPFHTDGEVLVLAFQPDGTLWSFEEPGVLRHWDMPDKQRAHASSGRTGQQLGWHQLDTAATLWGFSGDVRLFGAGGQQLSLWDIPSGNPLLTLPQPSWVTALAFAPGARASDKLGLVATGHDDGVVRLWDVEGQRLVRELAGHQEMVCALAFSADGKRLASSGEDKLIHLWDVEKGTLQGRLVGHTDRVPALAWHPDGQRLYSAGWDTTVRVWNTLTCEPIILLNSHATQVHTLTLTGDGALLASADSAAAVHVWRTSDNRTLCVFREDQGEIHALSFSPDGKQLVSGGSDCVIRLWSGVREDTQTHGPAPAVGRVETAKPRRGGQTAAPSPLSELLQPPATQTLALTGDGRRLVSAGGGNTVRVWDTATVQLQAQLEEAQAVQAVAVSPDGHWLADSTADSRLHLWDLVSGQRHHTLEGSSLPTTSLAFSADSTLLVSASSQGGDVWVWDVATGEPVLLIPDAVDGCSVEAVAFHPRNRWVAAGGMDWLATGGSDGAVSVWDIDARHEVLLLDGGSTRIAFHPSGERLAAASLSHSIRVWDLPLSSGSPTLRGVLSGHTDAVTCVAYSPNGRLLATGGDDHTLRLWDADTGAALGSVELDTQPKTLAFSPDSEQLFTGNANTSCYQLEVRQLRS
jgi:WD40 repeat protein